MSEEPLIAVFVDFENLAIGVREMKSGQFEIQLVLLAKQHEGARFGELPFTLLEDVGDVVAGEGMIDERILDGAGDLLCAVDIGQGDDLAQVQPRQESLRSASCR